MSNQDTPRFLTERQLADLLKEGLSTIQQRRYRGKGPHYVRLGRTIRYAWEDVERWLARHTVQTDQSR